MFIVRRQKNYVKLIALTHVSVMLETQRLKPNVKQTQHADDQEHASLFTIGEHQARVYSKYFQRQNLTAS